MSARERQGANDAKSSIVAISCHSYMGISLRLAGCDRDNHDLSLQISHRFRDGGQEARLGDVAFVWNVRDEAIVEVSQLGGCRDVPFLGLRVTHLLSVNQT